MRAYYFGNMYLSSIQQGIQAAHVTHELFNKYVGNPGSQWNTLSEWADSHKTMILLNAGYGENIHALSDRFRNTENPYPWANFYEAKESLDNAITCVGIILPEKIYESAARLRKVPYRDKADALRKIEDTGEITWWDDVSGEATKTTHQLSKWEFNLVQELPNYGLAR